MWVYKESVWQCFFENTYNIKRAFGKKIRYLENSESTSKKLKNPLYCFLKKHLTCDSPKNTKNFQ